MVSILILVLESTIVVILRSPTELASLRAAGRIVAHTIAAVVGAAKAGVRPSELDSLAAETIAALGAQPSFRGYHPPWARAPFPGVLCLSVNETIVHGIPDGRPLREGDLLSIDCGAHVDGYHGDAAVTIGIGALDPAGARLIETADAALAAGIAAAHPGGRLGDISHAIEATARAGGFGLPVGLGGHGVGTAMHEDPFVPNTGRPHRGLRLREGLVLAIEPMLIESGGSGRRTRRDGWTIDTADGSRAAHAEHTIAITDRGPEILTLL
jgi:methionyl aminopeptidase